MIEDRLMPHHAVAVDVAAVCAVHAVDNAGQLGVVNREQKRVLGRQGDAVLGFRFSGLSRVEHGVDEPLHMGSCAAHSSNQRTTPFAECAARRASEAMPSAAAARWRLSGGGDGSCRPIASVVLAGVVLAVDDPRVPEPKLLTDLLKVVDGGDQLTEKRVGIERRRDVSGRVRECSGLG
ncbi:hypothetical protein M3D75_05660 [Microbacterium enclense]|uniref:hypothetical protein n=1 Tax=Microbacterium enclense TaxID=993073 RepID=UPI0021A3C1E3|nr:hypothetical protein [Microbacterium enclense]MCT2085596.1 hypothetical protein [Microbacterium enclense]